VATVERALALHGSPVYVRKEIVHNRRVVDDLRARGAIFVDELDDSVPEGAVTIFSAHGVSPGVRAEAARRALRTVDATCPLVTKVHEEVRRFAAAGYSVILVGHAGHEEVEGTVGEAPDVVQLVRDAEDVDGLRVPDPARVAYVTQTTLAVDDTRWVIELLRTRFPAIVGPRLEDICFATSNRQAAVKRLVELCGLVLVVGSRNSSNTARLVEVAAAEGGEAHRLEDAGDLRADWLRGRDVVGVTAGASAPEVLIDELLTELGRHRSVDVEELEVCRERRRFMLPQEVRPA
jgi:4-hydroxy-3-methylbut-2-enyl diphosphate reductase